MKKNLVSIILFAIAAVILCLGIWQGVLSTKMWMRQIEDYLAQGAPQELVNEYIYWGQYVPDLLRQIITVLGLCAVLTALGLLLFERTAAQQAVCCGPAACDCPHPADADDDIDELFEDLEAVE